MSTHHGSQEGFHFFVCYACKDVQSAGLCKKNWKRVLSGRSRRALGGKIPPHFPFFPPAQDAVMHSQSLRSLVVRTLLYLLSAARRILN